MVRFSYLFLASLYDNPSLSASPLQYEHKHYLSSRNFPDRRLPRIADVSSMYTFGGCSDGRVQPRYLYHTSLPGALAEAMPTPNCIRRAGYHPTFSKDSTTIHTMSIVRNELSHLENTQSIGHGKRSAHIFSACPVPRASYILFLLPLCLSLTSDYRHVSPFKISDRQCLILPRNTMRGTLD